MSPALAEAAGRAQLGVTEFSGKRELRRLVESQSPSRPFLIYQLDMLVPGDLTEKYRFFNLHRGDLRTNRGPSPDVWPILLGERESALSLHLINDKVDAGTLIDEFRVAVGPDDDTRSVRDKLEVGLPVLIASLHDYLEGRRSGEVLVGGRYRPWVTEADFTIDLARDSLAAIERKILSQRQYNGAILLLDGRKEYVTEIVSIGGKMDRPSKEAAAEETIVAHAATAEIVFRRNPSPRFAPPPQRPPSKRV